MEYTPTKKQLKEGAVPTIHVIIDMRPTKIRGTSSIIKIREKEKHEVIFS